MTFVNRSYLNFGVSQNPQPQEFHQTTFCSSPFLSSRLLSFFAGGVEFRIGDEVGTRTGVHRIEALSYSPELQPTFMMRLSSGKDVPVEEQITLAQRGKLELNFPEILEGMVINM